MWAHIPNLEFNIKDHNSVEMGRKGTYMVKINSTRLRWLEMQDFAPTASSVGFQVHASCLTSSLREVRIYGFGCRGVDDLTKEGFWEEETQASDDFREERTRASDIINRVILRHKAKRVDTLTLSYVNCNEYQLDTLITTAIDRSIRNLYLEHSLDTFPRYLFNCKTIVDLKLYNYGVSLSAVDNVSLPSLKKFYVSNLVCENDDALPRFLSGCPSLEELNMAIHFGYDYVGCINITSPTIKTLKLDIDYIFRPSNLEYRMIINAPAITYLQVYGYDFALEWITIPTTMNSLVEADIHLKHYWFFLFHVKTYYNSMEVDFLHSLCYVKCLTISGPRTLPPPLLPLRLSAEIRAAKSRCRWAAVIKKKIEIEAVKPLPEIEAATDAGDWEGVDAGRWKRGEFGS
ncbi:Unknown protein [Striga hermonthica]|uniref:F-box/LRR-repeat protein 15/At3g58940/PEG3-like LRR domain-containing protein n=1 Tax=Striga hermonthica TaxID=68872 RepID=A0A9N7R361_STRHE|nr:Unknown protein [Striga hermonthica]